MRKSIKKSKKMLVVIDLQNWSQLQFYDHYIIDKQVQINKNNYENDVFHVKIGLSA